MALFATEEEKKLKKEEKEAKKFQQFLQRYNLKNVDIEDYELLKNISTELIGTGLMDLGLSLSFGTSTEDRMKISKLNVLQEQNWIIINQLSRLNKNLKTLIEQNNK